MDVVLECFDTYLFDPIWASAFPYTPKPTTLNSISYGSNSTILSSSNSPSASISYTNNYAFEPASQWWNFPPKEAAYLTSVPRDDSIRQAINLYIITALFGGIVYFSFATLSYIFVFDKETFNHPKYLKNQMYLEIKQTLQSIPTIALLTTFCFWLEVRGYSKIYDTVEQGPGAWYTYLQVPLFLCFTDFCIYWIHRGLHHPWVYKRLHKPHHKWLMPTPFASHAFHPLDGFSQSLPYHVFPFLFPLQKYVYIGLFVFINLWTVMIHDGEYVANSSIINGAACHTMHHLYFNYNYGQFTTFWDRLGGSYRQPNMELFIKESKMSKEEWARQKAETEKLVVEVEGSDDRDYTMEKSKSNIVEAETKKVQ